METRETKNCPYCGEEILAVAKKCKHCGNWLTETSKDPKSQGLFSFFGRFWKNYKIGILAYTTLFLAIFLIVYLTSERKIILKNDGSFILGAYDDAGRFSEGLADVKKGSKWGFVDKNGNEVIPCIYDDAWFFSEGLAFVKKDDKYGIMKLW
jgi:hypothetical protein